MKKVNIEICAEYVDWQELLEKLKDIISETTKEISNLEINYSESKED